MRQRRKRGSYRTKVVDTWGFKVEIIWGRLYLAVFTGGTMRSWWIEW